MNNPFKKEKRIEITLPKVCMECFEEIDSGDICSECMEKQRQ